MKSTLTFYGRSITRSHFLIFCPNNVRMSQQAIKSFSGFHYILSHQPSPKNFFVKSFSRYFGQFWWRWSILVKIRDIIFLVMWLVVVTMKQLLNIDFRTSHFNHFINTWPLVSTGCILPQPKLLPYGNVWPVGEILR